MSENFSTIQNNEFARRATSETGERGERLAANHLVRLGYRLVMANFKVPVGRNSRGALVTGEIDLIAYDEDKLCFVEVKTRTSDEFIHPLAAVDLRKQRQIIRTARVYRRIFHLPDSLIRYDAMSIVLPANDKPRVELFKNYFAESKFRKNFWANDFSS